MKLYTIFKNFSIAVLTNLYYASIFPPVQKNTIKQFLTCHSKPKIAIKLEPKNLLVFGKALVSKHI